MQWKGTFSNTHGLPSEPTELPIGWIPRAFSLGVKRKDYILTSSRMNGPVSPLLPCIFVTCTGTDLLLNFFLCSNNFSSINLIMSISCYHLKVTPYFVINNFCKCFFYSWYHSPWLRSKLSCSYTKLEGVFWRVDKVPHILHFITRYFMCCQSYDPAVLTPRGRC